MKKYTKHLFSLMMAVVMMFSLTISGFAAGLVTYSSEGEKFDFAPGTEYSDTDLFDELKDMMPGDEISQTVRFVYNGKSGVTAKVYLKAVIPTDETGELVDKELYQALLSVITLKVEGEKGVLYEGPANEPGNLGEFVEIASLRKGGETDLNVTAKLDVKADNDFRDKAAKIQWVFKIEEIPDPPYVPDTGDNTNVMLYGGMFGFAAMALIVLIILKKKEKEE